MVPQEDLKVLVKAMGMINQKDDPKSLTPPVTPATVGRRSVLDSMKFGPGNRLYWEMKEGRVSTRYPDLLRTLSKTRDPGQRRLLFESHRRNMDSLIGNSARRLERKGIGLSGQ